MSDEQIEERLQQCAPILPPQLRNRVLESCAIKAQQQAHHNRRANWRLAWGFAFVCVLHFGVGGVLESQQRALLGVSSNDATRYAANPADLQASLVLRSQLLAELSDPRRRNF